MCLCNYLKTEILFISIIIFYLLSLVSSEKIVFPDGIDKYKEELTNRNQDKSEKFDSEEYNEIPIDIIQKLNSIQNASQLYEEFTIKDSSGHSKGGIYGMASRLRTSPFLSDRSGITEDEIRVAHIGVLESAIDGVAKNGNIRMPTAAICKPELQTVPLYQATDRRIVAFPSCTRIERCGGCCQHELLSCQPETTEIVTYQIILMRYANNRFQREGNEIVTIEKHTSCKCKCDVKKEHCTALQEYIERECKCACTNKDEEKKCSLQSETKLWDPQSCACKCREITECSSGQFFSENSCGCETIRSLTVRGSPKDEKSDYNLYRIIPTNFNGRKERPRI